MYYIENDKIKVAVQTKGAELDSVYNKQDQVEYIWNGDPEVWGKKSPILFPIIGTLKEDTYYFEGKTYQLPRHGFARDMEFAVATQTNNSIRFTLESNDATLLKFPFPFKFDITYTVHANQLSVSYLVTNTGNGVMHFSVGGHPAFRVPLVAGLDYHDYFLEFNEVENTGRWPISKEGLIEKFPLPMLIYTNHLPLTKELFYKDALVFKHLASSQVTLKSHKNRHGLLFDFKGFSCLGIWAAKDSDFVCIEPWCGNADNVETDQQLEHKEGIEPLPAGEIFERTWTITLF
jgi:galactose mutarotase-like enzyme